MKIWIFVLMIVSIFSIACTPQQKVVEQQQAVPDAVPAEAPVQAPAKVPTTDTAAAPQQTAPEKQAVEEFVVEGDDMGLYPNSVTASKGDLVKITFKARSQGTYHGGLDFKSSAWGTTGMVKAGESKTVEFTATETVEFKSYWPSTGVLKATGKVIVN